MIIENQLNTLLKNKNNIKIQNYFASFPCNSRWNTSKYYSYLLFVIGKMHYPHGTISKYFWNDDNKNYNLVESLSKAKYLNCNINLSTKCCTIYMMSYQSSIYQILTFLHISQQKITKPLTFIHIQFTLLSLLVS